MIKSELRALDVFTRYFVTLDTLMKTTEKHENDPCKKALRCGRGTFLMCVVGRYEYEIILYPHLSSVQPPADSHVNLCNPYASSCCSQ